LQQQDTQEENKMKSATRFFLISLALAAVILAGCSEDTSMPEVGEGSFATLRTYLLENDLDLPDILTDWIIDASDVEGNLSAYYVMDIRTEELYDAGHIPGAVRSSLAGIVADAAANGGKTIVVACKTGQTAAHAVVALRLSGYSDAKSLKWGMSGWNAAFDLWTANTASIAVGHANWSMDATASLTPHDYPILVTTATDGAGILAERVSAMLAGGFKGVDPDDVLASPGDYFINNYWAQDDVDTYGHIDGAYRINPLTLDANEFMYYDPDETVVTYCWTGQTSSAVTAYLTILGYDARSLKFGANALIYSELQKSKWGGSASYTYETSAQLLVAQ
jgi:rhodanese-related sulfurtransferase